MTLTYFPRDLLREAQMLWEIQGAVVGSTQTASGVMPLSNLGGGGLWKATLGQIGLWTPDKRRTWRALSAICDNGSQPIVASVRETVDSPWPVVAGSPLTSLAPVGHSDDALFDDGTGYDSSVIEINVVGAALLRATAMKVNLKAASSLRGGEYFSIDHFNLRWRLYRIKTAVNNNDGTWKINFRPPLRADVADGTELDFDNPKCVMRLASPDSMDVTLTPPFNSDPSVSFIEAFPPFPV